MNGQTYCSSLSSVTPCVMEGQILSCLLDAGGAVLLLEVFQLPQLQRSRAESLHHLWCTCNIAPQFHPTLWFPWLRAQDVAHLEVKGRGMLRGRQ